VEKKVDWKKVKKIGGIVANVVVWLFVIFSLLITIMVFSAQGSADGVPTIFGKGIITISTESMEPTFKKGDMVKITKLDEKNIYELEVGDIITFRSPIDLNGDGVNGDINTHRIVEINEAGFYFVTKGDNNLIADNEGTSGYTVSFNNVIGSCEEDDRVPLVGGILAFLRTTLGFFLVIVLPLILFFLYELYNFINVLVTERAKRKPVNKETEDEIKKRAIEEYLAEQARLNGQTPPAPQEVAPEAPAEKENTKEE
jgi:signal peptidase